MAITELKTLQSGFVVGSFVSGVFWTVYYFVEHIGSGPVLALDLSFMAAPVVAVLVELMKRKGD